MIRAMIKSSNQQIFKDYLVSIIFDDLVIWLFDDWFPRRWVETLRDGHNKLYLMQGGEY